MKVRYLIGCVCMGLMLTACGRKESVDLLTQIQIGDNKISLKQGERVEQSCWNEFVDAVYTDSEGDETNYKDKVFVNGKITIGSNVKEVTEAFDIQPGEAIVNREIGTTEGDGTTDIVEEVYASIDFFEQEHVLDARFSIVYEKMNGTWVKLANDSLREFLYGEASKEKEYLVYEFDFVGAALAGDTEVNEMELIDLAVYYQ